VREVETLLGFLGLAAINVDPGIK